MTNLAYLVKRNKTTLLKTASYYVIHVVVAAIVAYAVTRSLVAAITLSLLEPTTQQWPTFCTTRLGPISACSACEHW